VTAEKNCFQESFKAVKTIRISRFNWQRVSDCRARIKKDQQTYVLYRQRGTVRRFRLVDRKRRRRGATSEAGWGTEAPGHADTLDMCGNGFQHLFIYSFKNSTQYKQYKIKDTMIAAEF